MSIQSEIDRINQAKTDLAAAIESKGVTVPPNTTINVYPGLVQQIEQGAGLPSGGTPGQMLYQGESGPEWGDKPVMVVNVSGDPVSGWTADKTFAEINDAFNSGYFVYAKCEFPFSSEVSAPLLMTLFYVFPEQMVLFSSFSVNDGMGFIFSLTATGQCSVMYDYISAGDVVFGPGATGLTADNVQDAIEEVNEKIPAKPIYRTVTLPASGWSSNTQTVTVSGVLADETAQLIQPMPAMASQSAYYGAEVLCSGQAANQLTFKCSTVPTDDISLYVVITEVRA